MPSSPTRPLLQSCLPAHWTQSRRSAASRAENVSSTPCERPAPRESTRTHTYPSGTHFSGSGSSQTWKRLLVPSATSGNESTIICQAVE